MASDESSDRSLPTSMLEEIQVEQEKLREKSQVIERNRQAYKCRTRSDPNMDRHSSYRQFIAPDESSDRSPSTSKLDEIQAKQEELRGKSQVIERNRTRSEPHINRLSSFRQFMAADESSDGCLSRPQNLTRFKLSKKSSGKSPR